MESELTLSDPKVARRALFLRGARSSGKLPERPTPQRRSVNSRRGYNVLVRRPWALSFCRRIHWSADEHRRAAVLQKTTVPYVALVRSQLNGARGEVTGTDDQKKGGNKGQSKPKRPPAQPPKKKQSKGRSAAVRKARGQTVGMPLPLSPCAQKYALAISEPFHPNATGACVPSFPSRNSQKVTAFIRGTLTTSSTTNVGFIAVVPTLANDGTVAWTTTSAFNGTTLAGSGAGVVPRTLPNLPWSTASLLSSSGGSVPPAISGRIVSIGVRLWYSGTELNRGGVTYALCEPNHGNLLGMDATNLGAYVECVKASVSRDKPAYVFTAGIDAEECQYPEHDSAATAGFPDVRVYPFSQGAPATATSLVGAAPLAIMIVSGAPSSNFEFEIVEHVEYVGAASSAMATPSHSDANGFQMVQNAAGRLPSLMAANPTARPSSLMASAIRTISHELSPYARAGVRMVGAAGLQVLGSTLTRAAPLLLA